MLMGREMEIREVDKLALCHDGLRAAYRAGMILQEKGWMLWPAAAWKQPAVLAFVGDRCVAGVNWSIDEDDGSATVSFAWCSPEHHSALTACLLRLRKRLRESPPTWLSFTCHKGNGPMEKLVQRLKLEPHSFSYRVPGSFYQAKECEAREHKPLLSRIREAYRALVA
jgi:hypothetical protein